MALDADRNVLIRGQALSALVETRSISADSAITLAQSLLLSDLLGAGRYTVSRTNPVNEEIRTYTFLPSTQDHILLTTLLDVMPAGLPLMLRVYSNTRNQYSRISASNSLAEEQTAFLGILNDTMAFWISLFEKTVSQFTDQDLAILNSDEFLQEHLPTLDAIVPRLSTTVAYQWMNRKNKSLRILGALSVLSENSINNDTTEANRAPTEILKSFMYPATDEDSFEFSSQVVKLLHRRAIVSSELGAKGFETLMSERLWDMERIQIGERENPAELHFHVTADYLVWLGRFPQIAKVLEDSVRVELREFLNWVEITPESALDYGKHYWIEWALIRFLLTSNAAADLSPSEGTHALLCHMFSIGEGKLRRINVKRYADEYNAKGSCKQ